MEKENGNKIKCNNPKKLKFILIIDLIILMLLAIWMTRNAFILNSIVENGEKIKNENVIYTKYVSSSKDETTIKEVYFDNGKGAVKTKIYNKNTLDILYKKVSYYDGEKRSEFIDNQGGNKSYVVDEENGMMLREELDTYTLSFENTWHFIKACLTARIRNVQCNGEDVYRISGVNPVIEKNSGELYWYIDKESGLIIRIYGRDNRMNQYAKVYDMVEDFTVEINSFRFKDLVPPDVNEYMKK